MKSFYSKLYYKQLDFRRKASSFFRKLKYILHPDIKIANGVFLGSNVKISVLYGGSIKIGGNTEILDSCKILTYGGDIVIGSNCSLNPATIVYGHGNTFIGDNVLIAGQSMIIPANHKFENINQPINRQGLSIKGIRIFNNVWIGHGCTITDGVEISEGAVIAAGSVITKDVAPYTVVAGVPAKIIRKYD